MSKERTIKLPSGRTLHVSVESSGEEETLAVESDEPQEDQHSEGDASEGANLDVLTPDSSPDTTKELKDA